MDIENGLVPPTVETLLARVMQGVDAITKTDRNSAQGYMFRGVDATMNTVGPVLREHGLVCVPYEMSIVADREVPTSRGGIMRSVTVKVGWRFIGPQGDDIEVITLGEAADTGDKAIPKATSVAYRELWLKTLCVPTEDPQEDVDKNPPPERGAPAQQRQVDPATAERLNKEIDGRRSENGLRESWANVSAAYETGELSTEDYTTLTNKISAAVQTLRARQRAEAASLKAMEQEETPENNDEGEYQ